MPPAAAAGSCALPAGSTACLHGCAAQDYSSASVRECSKIAYSNICAADRKVHLCTRWQHDAGGDWLCGSDSRLARKTEGRHSGGHASSRRTAELMAADVDGAEVAGVEARVQAHTAVGPHHHPTRLPRHCQGQRTTCQRNTIGNGRAQPSPPAAPALRKEHTQGVRQEVFNAHKDSKRQNLRSAPTTPSPPAAPALLDHSTILWSSLKLPFDAHGWSVTNASVRAHPHRLRLPWRCSIQHAPSRELALSCQLQELNKSSIYKLRGSSRRLQTKHELLRCVPW